MNNLYRKLLWEEDEKMARVVDYFKKLLKKEHSILTTEMIKKNLSLCEEFKYEGVYDLNNMEFCEALGKITRLRFFWNWHHYDMKDGKKELEELKLLLKYMSGLRRVSIENWNDKRIDMTSIFESFNEDIKLISFSGVDFRKGISKKMIQRLKNLRVFCIENSNIPNIPDFFQENCVVNLGEGVDKSEYNGNSQIMDEEELYKFRKTFFSKEISAQEYEKYREFVKQQGMTDIIDTLMIENVNDLSLERLQALNQNGNIKRITTKKYMRGTYDIETYAAIRMEIDKIVAMVELPEQDDPDREKKIFAQVYKILGNRISYDHYAMSEEGEFDSALEWQSRNLENGLLGVERDGEKKYLSVCAGYAEILRNVLSCFEIESKYVSSLNIDSKRKGHAYNLVLLDGQKYYCDLTFDAANIKAERYPLAHFLVSYEDFLLSHYEQGFTETIADKEADVQLSLGEQYYLFNPKVDVQAEVEKMLNENYLSGFVSWYLDYSQQIKGSLEQKDFFSIIYQIKSFEDEILSPRAENNNVKFESIDAEYIFNTTDMEERKKLKKQIEERRMRESGHESR